MELYVTFKLTGWHALWFRQMMRIANMAPGPKFDESGMAKSLIEAIMEDDAKSHSMCRLN